MTTLLVIWVATMVGAFLNFVAGFLAAFIGYKFVDDQYVGIAGGAVAGMMINAFMGLLFQSLFQVNITILSASFVAFVLWATLGVFVAKIVTRTWGKT